MDSERPVQALETRSLPQQPLRNMRDCGHARCISNSNADPDTTEGHPICSKTTMLRKLNRARPVNSTCSAAIPRRPPRRMKNRARLTASLGACLYVTRPISPGARRTDSRPSKQPTGNLSKFQIGYFPPREHGSGQFRPPALRLSVLPRRHITPVSVCRWRALDGIFRLFIPNWTRG